MLVETNEKNDFIYNVIQRKKIKIMIGTIKPEAK